MKNKIKKFISRQSFYPGFVGIWINPFYFARDGLAKAMIRNSHAMSGKLLDVGCGSKPYEFVFDVDEYIGLDIINENSQYLGCADYFYDGTFFPFKDSEFDSILCNQVLEHVFNPDLFLREILRVMNKNAKLLLTVPFVWDEHEQPYDYARYSSFGLKALLEKNGFTIINHEKVGADVSVIFQLFNAYLYKVTSHWGRFFRLFFTILVIGPLNLFGLIVKNILPINFDLYLDNVIIAERSK